MDAPQFSWVDYFIFGITLLIPVFIGVFYAVRGQKTPTEFLLGGRDMPLLPTALSLIVSFQSGILILGFSSEMYVKGTHIFWYIVGFIIGLPMAAFGYQPIFYKLQLTSAYQYLELRFHSRLVRLIGSVLFMASTLMYMAIVLYAPATALSAVSGLNVEVLVVVSGLACTFYTALGGLKAVVWTDAFQAVIMYMGVLAIIIQGTLEVGSLSQVWQRVANGGRLVTDFDPNPFTYMNFYAVVFGTAFGWMNLYGTNQTVVQRYTSLRSLKRAQTSLLLVMPGLLTMYPLVILCGLVMYAYYHDCDPLMLGLVSNRDQLLPFFTVEVLGYVKGMPGIFLACLYSGTLSTVSSGVNSLAAVLWEDVVKATKWGQNLSDEQATKLNKISACGFGLFSIALACVAKFLGGVLQAVMTVMSMLGGPLAGLFLFGMIFPWGNKQGALAGVLGSSAIMAWICIGAQIVKPYRKSLPRTISGCTNATLQAAGWLAFNNGTYSPTDKFQLNQTSIGGVDIQLTGISYIYRLSYKLYGVVAIVLVFAIGIPVSLVISRGSLNDADAYLVWPLLRRFCVCLLPKRWIFLLEKSEEDIKVTEKKKLAAREEGQKKSQEPVSSVNVEQSPTKTSSV